MARLYVKTRQQWRKWLQKNYSSEKEVWLIYYKKQSGKPGILYDDAVEEAICFGWIDSTVRKIDDERYMQRYTPRNLASIWSQPNIARAKKMINERKMTEAGLAKFKKRKIEAPERISFPDDLRKALMDNKKAWENFRKLPPSIRKIWFWWIISAKKDGTRKRRIERSVDAASRNKRFANM